MFISIPLNESPTTNYQPYRGNNKRIRKRDPSSPFLFIIIVDGLGKVINDFKAQHEIRYDKIGRVLGSSFAFTICR